MSCAALDGPGLTNFNGAVARHPDGGLVMAYRNYERHGRGNPMSIQVSFVPRAVGRPKSSFITRLSVPSLTRPLQAARSDLVEPVLEGLHQCRRMPLRSSVARQSFQQSGDEVISGCMNPSSRFP